LFKRLMKQCFGVEKFYEISCKNAISVRVFSKNIADYLFRYSPTYRTLPLEQFPKANERSVLVGFKALHYNSVKYPPCKIPEEIFSQKRCVAAFLRGFTSGDGSICINKKHSIYRVELTCYHPFLRKQSVECLSALGIPASARRNSVYVSGIANYQKFLRVVGFVR